MASWHQRCAMNAMMGAAMGATGVVVGTYMQIGRMPPVSQVGGAAAFMATVFGAGALVR
jgi:hypothetical protein|tara:strand:- start:924 stop:1100 length:177 start_codon:yes stop_codon:yes gene_type:complete